METSAETSENFLIIQFIINQVAAQSYSQMNAYGSALQLIIYNAMMLDLKFDDDAEKSFQGFLSIV